MRRAVFRKIFLAIFTALLASGCAGPRKAGNLPNWEDPRVRFVGAVLLAYQKAAGRGGERWYLGILAGRGINAYSGPGGWFYITEGFLRLRRPFQAVLLAHEAGHRVKGHIGTQRIETGALKGSVALDKLAGDESLDGGGDAKAAPSVAERAAFNAFSRAQELEADRLASCLMIRAAGGKPNFGIRNLRHFFRALGERGAGEKGGTHPHPEARAAQLGRIISGELAPCPPGWNKRAPTRKRGG